MPQLPIWSGTSTFSTGATPYGFYDSDSDFSGSSAHSVDRFADWAAKRLGYPIIDIELQSGSFYACYEESITEYSAQVNQFNIKDNLLSLQGQPTSSNLTHRTVTNSFGRFITLSEQYGTEAGVGGTVDFKTGSIDIVSGSQEYDLDALWTNASESVASSGSGIEVRKVYYEGPAAVNKYFDPYAGVNQNNMNMLDAFGWGNYSPSIQFLMMPMYADLLRIQAIELNDQIRKSAYSFEMTNNKIRIFPKPVSNYKLYFKYLVKDDRGNPLKGSSTGRVSDISNAPYDNMEFKHINDVGKQWIKKYALALCKELLGTIRSKYSSVPIPNADVTMDGDTLRNEAASEKEILITQLREILEQTSRKAMMEAERDESEALQEKLQKVPYPIYIG